MRLLDVNILVNAHRRDAERHTEYRAYLEDLVHGDEPYAVTDMVVNGFIRIVTLPRLPNRSRTEDALLFADQIRNQPHATIVNPGGRHWGIFTRLCKETRAAGKLIPDAYLAALAIEHGCEFITCDKDFAIFPGLRSRHPLN
ncbi:type II toxin-antitoxin system VapC family toxin [Planotetraspora sp. A-T 1434]|uniref:type II toxin-antitoxin system VapC family toxin n=1 Tax=Planotetraspora sp. A-T 1434 TaxID=2979219 RepID=UPI0021C076E8|nr:type II toxin-antitoxin system VapC family toxin [Planotetraspora sp. A-T 1434]MCT9931275.1 type II toxin-antitoxin system VapC family toxin [Planotetraspora sp. A-T 1434]